MIENAVLQPNRSISALEDTVFLDKPALAAFMNPEDPKYAKARTYFVEMEDLGRAFSTSNLVLYELHRWLRNEYSYALAEMFLQTTDEAVRCGKLHVIAVSEQIEQDARQLLSRFPEYELSLDEAVTAVVILSNNIRRVFTFNLSLLALSNIDSHIKIIPSPSSV